MPSSTPWSALLFGSILTLSLTACPQSQTPDGKGGPEGQAGSQGDPPEMGSAAHPDDARWELKAGEGVSVQGSVSYAGEVPGGAVRIDVLTQVKDAPPHLVSAETLEGLGEFTFQAPSDFGEVHLVAFIDRTGDGPSPDDPAATVKLDITTENVAALELVLTDEPELGELTPGSPPDGAGQPTDGQAGDQQGDGPPPEEGAGPGDDGPPGGEGPPPEAEPGSAEPAPSAEPAEAPTP